MLQYKETLWWWYTILLVLSFFAGICLLSRWWKFFLIRLHCDIQRGNNVSLVVVYLIALVFGAFVTVVFRATFDDWFLNVSCYSRFQRFYSLVWVVALQRINWWKWWRLLSILEDPSRISTCAAFRPLFTLNVKLICPFSWFLVLDVEPRCCHNLYWLG